MWSDCSTAGDSSAPTAAAAAAGGGGRGGGVAMRRSYPVSCIIAGEVAAVLAVMRRNVRWGILYPSSDSAGAGSIQSILDDHPLIASLCALRRVCFSSPGSLLRDPSLILAPFLDIVRSDETSAPITGAALSSLHKILSLDLVLPPAAPLDGGGAEDASAAVSRAMGDLVDAVTACKFEVTDQASEEAALVKILQLLLVCVRGRGAPALSNKHVCAVVSTCFRIVQQAATKGELLQRVSRQSMQEVVRCVFARLPALTTSASRDSDVAKPSTSSEIRGLDCDVSMEVESGKADFVILSSTGDEVGEQLDGTLMEPFGTPCMVEILHFLCSILNIAEDIDVNQRMNSIDFEEDVPLFALMLINTAVEVAGSSIGKDPKLLLFVQDELFRNLIKFGLSLSPLILSTVCNIVLNLFYHLRQELKLQIEAFFSSVILRLAQSRYGASYQQQEVAMEALVDFCRQKEFMAEMYANMDSDILCSNVFEDLGSLLSKSAFPVNSPVSSMNVLALDGLVAVLQAIAERIDRAPRHLEQGSLEISEYAPFWIHRCEDVSDPDIWIKFVRRQKSVKRRLATGVEHFNKDYKKGFEYLRSVHILPEKLDPKSVALFFRYTSGLDKNKVGDYLGSHDNFAIQVLHEFARMFDFRGMGLDTALRHFLETFWLPGEAQKIHRVLEAFSERYYEQSPHIFANKDAALVLSYSIIMLNTDQHNVRVKKKMTEEDFIRNNRHINGGNDLPREFLSELYYSICRKEIRTIPDQGSSGLPEMSFSRWIDVMSKAKKASPYILYDSHTILDQDMFAIMAGPAVAAISVIFDNVEHEDILQTCVGGFLAVAKLAAYFNLDDVLNDLVVAVCKFIVLPGTSYTGDPVVAFGEDNRARMAMETAFMIATNYGDHIRVGWRKIVECIVRMNKIRLLPASLTSDLTQDQQSPFGTAVGEALAHLKSDSVIAPVSVPKKSYGLMGRFSQFLLLDAEEAKPQPTEEQLSAQRKAFQTVKICHIGSIFAESKFLQADSLSHLARALIQAAGMPHKTSNSLDDEDTAVFCLDLLITVTLNNRDRIVLLWPSVYEHIARIVQSSAMPCNIVEKAVFGLLHICQRLLPYKENLADDLLRSLQLILKLDARVADAYCENITQEVTRLVKANATHIKSQLGWRTITSLISITARHPDAFDAGFEALVYIMSGGAHLSPANFVLCVEAARQFVESRLGSTEKSVKALDLMSDSMSCLTRWSCEVKEVGGEAERILEGITEMWLRLVQALKRVCTDQREEVRNHSLVALQGCIVGAEGIPVSAPAWLQCFDNVLQLLDDLLEICQRYSPKDFRNMESSLLHGMKLLSKVFLQSLKDVSSDDSFRELWQEVLSQMEKYIKAKVKGRKMEKLQEVIPELLKNLLLVMKASGLLSPSHSGDEGSIWEVTRQHVSNISPSLESEVFPHSEEQETPPENENDPGNRGQLEGKSREGTSATPITVS